MSAGTNVAFAATASPPAERRAVRRSRPRPRIALVTRPVSFWCVSCFVCGALSPLATNPDRGARPPKNSGFVYLAIGAVAGWACGECHWKYRTMLPPATRGECVDGPRPCRALLCRYNLWFDRSRKAAKSFVVLETCALDVAERNTEGMTLKSLGELLGMTREGSRYIESIALNKVRAIGGLEVDFDELIANAPKEDDDADPA